tara:strand:+ start:155 stop:373 length:219 start_codon:yes stop_codon:yes gene_type:complete
MKTSSSPLRRALNNFAIAFAIILIWRGVWYILDWMDALLFFNNHSYSALGGIVIGILILYLPDKDLGELGKL